jgi:hypothetical protein
LILVCSGPNHAAKAQHWNLGGWEAKTRMLR